MNNVFARKAFLHKGWADNVRLGVRAGRIESIGEGCSAEPDDFVTGIAIPGLCNAHSHAFQRALAGRTEQRSPAGRDNFWTWRERMYALAGQVDARSLAAIASQAYAQMLASGYTAVAEFHYLHHDRGGGESSDAMYAAIVDAGARSGIRITYVPVLYERADFEQPQAQRNQRPFVLELDDFLQHHKRVSTSQSARVNIGIGAHSLRAVRGESLQELAAVANSARSPMHLHIAEQQREVDQCLVNHGARPVRYILENLAVGENWCLVHATHMDAEEVVALAQSGAVVCLCPTTEANLGDGLFALTDFLSAGGRIAIGSDSHISINPFEELRWLEYGQRLVTQSRNVAAMQGDHVGTELFARGLRGGAQATGNTMPGLQVGAAADLVTLLDDDPMLLGHANDSLLDALVFSGYRLPIERVMVDGDWCVIDGDHVRKDDIRTAYATTLERMGLTQ